VTAFIEDNLCAN